MPITVSMIEEKEFKIKVRGYDPVEVDGFLDDICDQMEAMQEEISTLQAKLSQASQAPAPMAVPAPASVIAPPPIPEPQERAYAPLQEETGESAQRLLVRAQKFYDDTVTEAKEEAARILRDAQAKADVSVQGLAAQRDALQNEIAMLKDAAHDYKERFRRLLEDQRHVLDSEKELFQ